MMATITFNQYKLVVEVSCSNLSRCSRWQCNAVQLCDEFFHRFQVVSDIVNSKYVVIEARRVGPKELIDIHLSN